MPAKKTTTRRKTTKRPRSRKKRQDFKYTRNVIGFGVALLALFALLQLGVAGIFLANLLSVFVGNTYQVFAIILIALGIFVGVTGKWPSLPSKRIIGAGLIYLGVLLYDHLRLFTSLNYHTHFVSLT
ncbi:MAG TPA: cell division protein FtsK, partial [Lactobacillus sp.]|nr:cell division protein FtsK [Lactobacillus sp.]